MSVENALNFCNQYLMLKTLCTLNTKPSTPSQPVPKKKTARGQKFQNPTKKPTQQSYQPIREASEVQGKVKTRRKKFQGGVVRRQGDEGQLKALGVGKEKDKEEGYVPIQNLLSQLISKPQQRTNLDNFKSFGDTSWQNQNTHSFDVPSYSYQNYQSQNRSGNLWEQLEPKLDTSWLYSQPKSPTLNPVRSEYLFDSPIKNLNRTGTSYFVPPSRSQLRQQLDHSQSCSYLQSNSQNRSFNADQSKSKSKRKRKSQREFYMPITNANSGPKTPLPPDMSRCTSTNNIIAKLEREIFEQTMRNQEEAEKSQISETRFETKGKGKEFQQYSTIQLDNRIRESLSFISEANGPPKPINIQMRK